MCRVSQSSMNYRHTYHAGNFADVLKHIVLMRIIEHLKRKDKAFRVFDTHAGIGQYNLSGSDAQKTGEWRHGVGRLLQVELTQDIAPIVQPYLDLLQTSKDGRLLSFYPGSPMIARKLMRKQDRLSLSELHPKDARSLRELFAGDYQVRVNELDGWLAFGAHLPPKEKRGMVLVDPPFEQQDDFEKLENGLAKSVKRWGGGTYCLWYPVKHHSQTNTFTRRISELAIAKTLRVELYIRSPDERTTFNGCGLIIVNPPYTLNAELQKLMPWLAELLAQGPGAGFRVDWLTGE